MPDWKALVRARLAGAAVDEEVIDEVVQHAEDLFRGLLSAGTSEEACRAAVERELADVQTVIRAARLGRTRRLVRTVEPPPPGRLGPVRGFARDLAHGARLLAARPAFTAIAVLTLALGIGANTAVFGVVHSLLLQPLPFPAADRLVMLWESDEDDPDDFSIVSAPNFQDWTRLATSFDHTAIWEYQSFNIAGGAEPEQVAGLRVSSSIFPLLGIAPQLGRTFTEAEDQPGHDVVVISDGLWRRRFAASPAAIGQTMRLNGRPFEIVGVMPPSFRFTQQQAVWVPIQFNEEDAGRSSHSFYAAARLKNGVDFATAKAEMRTIGRQLAHQYEQNAGEIATISRMDELWVVSTRSTLMMLLGVTLLVLLIACVNVANLMLAQASVRQRELAIRTALGAGRGRIAAQLLAEGLVLAIAGGAAGVVLAWAGTAGLASTLPRAIRLAPFREGTLVPLDPAVLAFSLALAALTGLLFSVAPVLGALRTHPGAVLQAAGDRGGTARLTWLRSALVASEVGLALVVLTAAGLLIKSMMRLVTVDPGLDPSRVLTMTMALPQAEFYGAPERPTFCRDVVREVGSLPGVGGVGAVSHLPLSGANASRGFAIEGRPEPPPTEGASAFYRVTCPGYFQTLSIPITKGRDFTHDDTLRAPMVVVVNESTAARYWPGENPLGKRIKFGNLSSGTPWLTIVGVVRDVRHFGLDTDAYREIYRPYSQVVWPVMTITARTAIDPLVMAPAVRAALRRIDPDQPVTGIRSMEQVLDESLGARRFPMLLLGIFSAVALVLAAIGVYGVVSCVVSQRTREIGIRVALGARRASVIRLVVGRSLVPIAVGMVLGAAAALSASRLIAAMLYQVEPSDPAVLATIAAVLGGAALLASWIPARRAAGVDPVIVLKDA
jgi:putative ABC transport system permease protein